MPDPISAQPPVVDPVTRFAAVLKQGRNWAAQRDVAPMHPRAFAQQVRSALRRLYGEGSHAEELWPMIDENPPRERARALLEDRIALAARLLQSLQTAPVIAWAPREHCVFIGHGRSLVWLQLKDFLQSRMKLSVEEFNTQAAAGMTTTARLEQMLQKATVAFLIMTAEDEHADSTQHARENVIHELGLFQGRLGASHAIVLLEKGCSLFSNIVGITYIEFPKNDLPLAFIKVQELLEEREIVRLTVSTGERR